MTTSATILACAREEFLRKGFFGASIAGIAEAAETSKASVLYHFSSKEQLLDQVLEPVMDAIQDALTACEGVPAEPADPVVVAALESFVDIAMRFSKEVAIFLAQRVNLPGGVQIQRGETLLLSLRDMLLSCVADDEMLVRLGVALSGVVLLLSWRTGESDANVRIPDDRLRTMVLDLLTQSLLAQSPHTGPSLAKPSEE